MRKTIGLFLTLFLLTVTTPGCGQVSSAQNGASAGPDDHAHAEDGPAPVSVTLFTPEVLLFMEYPQLIQGEPAAFLAHFSVLATGEPVRSGTMKLEATAPDGTVEVVAADAPARPGIFIPEHAFRSAGTYQGRLILDSPQVQDAVDLGEMIVYPTTDSAHAAAHQAAGEDPPDAVPFLMEQQWKVGTLLGQVERRTLTRRLRLPGEITARPNAAAFVSAPVSGRPLPPASGELPMVGDYVEAGQLLAYIEPPLPATEAAALSANRAQLQAMETELHLRSLDLTFKGLEVERDLRQAEVRLDFARRAYGRIEVLMEKGVGSDQQHDIARQEVQLAEAVHDAALSLMESQQASAAKLAELKERMRDREVVPESGATVMQMPLYAPISGRIAARAAIQGEHVEALEEVCEIIDLERVWVVGRLSEFDLAELPRTPNATFQLPAFPDRSFDVEAMGGEFVGIGVRVDEQTRTVPIRFDCPNPDNLFHAGMVADVFLTTDSAVDCLAVPADAIVMDNGRPLVYVMLEGETFQRREVELGIRDNGWIEVVSGVAEGERVATRGAYVIKLAALSPASFGHGHGH
jgi:cobalt-zinc-cadmium efflux system membrane fusion protein